MVRWRAYGAYLKIGSFLVNGFRKTIVWLLVIIALLGISGPLIEASWFKVVTVILGVAALLLVPLFRWGATFAENIASVFESRAEALRKGMSELKSELAESLQLKTPVLVVLDDVDRLSADEIKLLFQLVKANADFPNLVYLLLFQRDIVENSLETIASISGREFLEKIVQVGFDIPQIERTRLEKVLFAGLNELLEDEAVEQRFNQQRWGNVFIPGLRPYFETLRDIHRFLATLSFHVALFRNSGSFEVNPIDLIALEVLRVFEPAVYHRLPEAKSALTEQRGHGLHRRGDEEKTRHIIESIVEQVPETNRPQIREILKQIFPPAQWIFGGPGYDSGFEEQWYRDLRVCHPDVFDRYFHLTIPEGDISQAELDRLLSLLGDREGLVAEFRALNKSGLLSVALDRLEAYKEKIDLQHAVPFITALYDIGDELPDEPTGFFSIGPDMHVVRIIHWYLKQEKDSAERIRLLKEAMKTSTGLYLPVMDTSLEDSKQERQKDPDSFTVTSTAREIGKMIAGERQKDPDSFTVTAEDLKNLQQICVEKIQQAAKSGVLKTHPKMAYILYRWREWASLEEPKKWVEGLIESEDGLLSVLTAFLQRSTSSGAEDYVSRIHWRISLKSIEDFVSVAVLDEKVGQLSLAGLGDKEQRAIGAFRRAVQRRQEGRSDDDWLHDSEDEE